MVEYVVMDLRLMDSTIGGWIDVLVDGSTNWRIGRLMQLCVDGLMV